MRTPARLGEAAGSPETVTPRAPFAATVEGRRLRLQLDGITEAFLVDPLPAKRGHALAQAFAEQGGIGSDTLFAEALGAANYARITGDLVQEFDGIGGYVQTWLPDACMVEPAEDVPPPRPGQRLRVVPAPWDGLAVRAEEVELLALASFCWQSPAGWAALDAFLRQGASRPAAAAVLPLQTVSPVAAVHAPVGRAPLPAALRPGGC